MATTQGTFVLEYWQDEGWYVGRLRGVPGIFSQGKSLEELEANIREAFQLMTADEEAAPAGSHTKDVIIEV